MKTVIIGLLVLMLALIIECGGDNSVDSNPPNAPTNLVGQVLSSSSIILYWVDNSDNESCFIIHRSQGESWDQIAVAPENAVYYEDSLLQDSTTYFYYVEAANSNGVSFSSDTVSVTTPSQDSVPNAPSDLVGQPLSFSSIQLFWTDNSTNETGFIIYRSQVGTWSQVATPPASQESHIDSLLQDTTTYSYYIMAVNGYGSSPTSDTISVTTLSWGSLPDIPSNPSPPDEATDQELNIQLSWQCSDPDGDTLTYYIYFGIGYPPPMVDSSRTHRTYDPGLLQWNSSYYWKIVAKDIYLHQTEGPLWSFNTTDHGIYLIGSCSTPGEARSVFVVGNYAYVADDYYGLQIIDIQNQNNPTLEGNYDTQGRAYCVFIIDNYAYVADNNSGLQIINISNPGYPIFEGNYDTPNEARGVFIDNNYAFVADLNSGLQIIDISNPSNPTFSGSYNTQGFAHDVYVFNYYAYVADDTSGLQIINVSIPTSPTLAGSYDTPGRAFGVFVEDNYAYIADYDFGLQIIDIESPTAPFFVGSFDTQGSAKDICIHENHAYIATEHGVQVINITDPTNPMLAENYDMPDRWVHSIFVADNHVYITDSVCGLMIFECIP